MDNAGASTPRSREKTPHHVPKSNGVKGDELERRIDCVRSLRDLVHHGSGQHDKQERRAARHPALKPYQTNTQTRPNLSLDMQLEVPTRGRKEGQGEAPEASNARASSSSEQPHIPERPVCLVRGAIYIQDYVQVSDFVKTGETVTSASAATSLSGKSVLQAVGVSRAGQRVELVGAFGRDGDHIPGFLSSFGVGSKGCSHPDVLEDSPTLSGRAITQYTSRAQCATIIIPGANNHSVDSAKDALQPSITHLIVQNEIDMNTTLDYIDIANTRGIQVIMNPSPLPSDHELHEFPWHKVAYLVLTESEAEGFVTGLKNVSTKFCTTRPPLETHTDGRVVAGLVPPIPQRAFSNLCALIQWPALSNTGIVIKLSSVGGGALAVLPSARGSSSKIYYEPAPPRELAFTIRGAIGDGSIDTIVGYFVAGLMEFALFDRFHLNETMWQGIVEKAVIASYLTPTSFPPTQPMPVHAIPHFPDVHQMLAQLQACYVKQLKSTTSLHPYPSEERSPQRPQKPPNSAYYPLRVATSPPSKSS